MRTEVSWMISASALTTVLQVQGGAR
uniref:Uncharacterized protein n=1 Tax=Anguilla anguilla TaxID=7936 RepID=A0A0E9UWU8_ANGAN